MKYDSIMGNYRMSKPLSVIVSHSTTKSNTLSVQTFVSYKGWNFCDITTFNKDNKNERVIDVSVNYESKYSFAYPSFCSIHFKHKSKLLHFDVDNKRPVYTNRNIDVDLSLALCEGGTTVTGILKLSDEAHPDYCIDGTNIINTLIMCRHFYRHWSSFIQKEIKSKVHGTLTESKLNELYGIFIKDYVDLKLRQEEFDYG